MAPMVPAATTLPTSTSSISSSATIPHMPLTTVFKPPVWCHDMLYTFSTEYSGISTFWKDAAGPGTGTNSACYPRDFIEQYEPTMSAEYSPGVCPFGYWPAQSEVNNLQAAQTSYCCPLGMSFVEGIGCTSTVSTRTRVVLNADTTTTISTTFVAADWYVKVAWATNQLDIFTPKWAPLLPPAFQTGANASNMSFPAIIPSALPTPPSTTFSTGEKVGLGAGFATFTIAVFAVAVFGLWRRKRKRPELADGAGLMIRESTEKGSAEKTESRGSPETTQASEASEHSRMSEDVPSSIRATLEGSWHDHQMMTQTTQ